MPSAISPETHSAIPVIDLAPSFTADLAARNAVAAQLRIACGDYGMFSITGHGIPSRVYGGVLEQAKRYYNLPTHIRDDIHKKLLGPYNVGANVTVNNKTKQSFTWKYEPRLDYDSAQAEGRG
ncbi:non-heme dioxygenase in morphine synthesis N-terminal-domain-containing protein [Macrophomina phaseolina]|nr:non-heme dioxygenase in morphine synthesis N-terminal-domain-containing protein [Macrophomina phaseolina]